MSRIADVMKELNALGAVGTVPPREVTAEPVTVQESELASESNNLLMDFLAEEGVEETAEELEEPQSVVSTPAPLTVLDLLQTLNRDCEAMSARINDTLANIKRLYPDI